MREDQAYDLLAPAVAAHVSQSEMTLFLIADADGTIVHANHCARRLLGLESEAEQWRALWKLLPESDADRLQTMLADGVDQVKDCPVNFRLPGHDCQTYHCRVWTPDGKLAILGEHRETESVNLRRKLMETNNELVVKSRELARRKRELEHAREKLQEAYDKLDSTYWHLKKIQEVLPICMECGKVKTSGADWEDVVEYLQRNALFLSHGYCPDCADRMREQYGLTGEEAQDADESV